MRVRTAALLIAFVSVAVAGATALWRAPLLERAGALWLASRGVANATFSVTRLDLQALVVEDFRAGDGALAFRRLEILYAVPEIVVGSLRAVTLDGLRVKGAVTGGGLVLPGIGWRSQPAGPGVPPVLPQVFLASLPVVAIGDARIHLDTASGPVTVAAGARLDLTPGTADPVALDAAFEIPSGRGRVSVTGAPTGDGAFDLEAAADVENLSLAPVSIRRAEAVLPLRLVLGPDAAVASLRADGRATLDALGITEKFALPGVTVLRFPVGDAPFLRLAFGDDVTLAYDIRAETAAAAVGVRPATGPARELRLDRVAAGFRGALSARRPHQGDAVFSLASVQAPALGFGATFLSGTMRLAAAPFHATGRVTATLADRRTPARIAPLAATVTFDLGARLRLDGTVAGPGGASLRFAGDLDMASQQGTATITVPSLAFSPGGLQPGALSPALSALSRVSGRISAEARFRLDPSGPQGSGRVEADFAVLEIGGVAFRGLGAVIDFDRLLPPRTAGDQMLTVARIGLPAPVTDLAARFRVEAAPSGARRLVVPEITGTFAGGTVRIVDAVLDPAVARQTVRVDLAGLDLETLLAAADIEGLAGAGTLGGVLPLTLGDGTISVAAGRLVARGPGRVRFHSDAARRLLAAGQSAGENGQTLDRALDALADFTYEELILDLDKPPRGNARVVLRLLGHNPAVLDGRKFQFNVALSSNVDDLLDVVLKGAGLATRALGRATKKP